MPDKYTATWLSHTSIASFLECPRAYYLRHVYKDPKNNKKIKLMTPPLALGQAVHEVLESLSVLRTDERFREPLMQKFETAWQKVSGKKGGFFHKDTELKYKERGKNMIRNVHENPGPLKSLAVKIQKELPYYYISEEENIILCGKIDWLEYLPESESVHIIDFKTGKNKEEENSLQLPIYMLLATNCQERKIQGASYWYLENNEIIEKELPNTDDAHKQVLALGQKIKLARKLEALNCPSSGCHACAPLEKILAGKGEFVGEDEYNYHVYILPKESESALSDIL